MWLLRLFGVGYVSTEPVVQRVDLRQLVAVFGAARVSFKCAAKQLHIGGRQQRAGSGRFAVLGFGIAHFHSPLPGAGVVMWLKHMTAG